MIRFFMLFLLLLAGLMVFELTPFAQQWIVVPWTSLLTRISAILVGAFDPDVVAYGKVLMDRPSGMGVSVEAGCNGIEACIILLSALLAYPSPWRMKLMGALCGMIAIQAVNVLRVITLFYLSIWNHAVFEFAHLYLWQALIMIDVLVVWLVWIRLVARDSAARTPVAGAPA